MNSLNSHNNPMKWFYFSLLAEEKVEAQRS